MGFRAAFTSAVRAVSRPHLVLPAAFVAVIALLSPPAVEDASAQGFRTQGSRGGSSSTGSGRSQYNRPGTSSKSAECRAANPDAIQAATPVALARAKAVRRAAWAPLSQQHSGHSLPQAGHGRNVAPTQATQRTLITQRVIVIAAPAAIPDPADRLAGGRRCRRTAWKAFLRTAAERRGGGGGQPSFTPPAQPSPPAINWGRYVPNEVVVEVASSVSPQVINALLVRHRLTQLETVNLQSSDTSIRRLRINDRRPVPTVVRALAAEGFTVQPNLIATLQEAAPGMSQAALEQYALARMRMPEAHTLATGSRVLIAVIDSGADAQHPELAGMILDTFEPSAAATARMRMERRSSAPSPRGRGCGHRARRHILMARAFGTSGAAWTAPAPTSSRRWSGRWRVARASST